MNKDDENPLLQFSLSALLLMTLIGGVFVGALAMVLAKNGLSAQAVFLCVVGAIGITALVALLVFLAATVEAAVLDKIYGNREAPRGDDLK